MRQFRTSDVQLTDAASTALEQVDVLQSAIERVIRGKPDAVRLSIVTLLAGGHLLVEDVPGVGKTTLAQALARAIDCTFQRIQFTSDLLPSDVIGLSVYDERAGSFEFKHGPIFANIVLADEINRTTPKTQSALLEAMAEGHVTVEGVTYRLRAPLLPAQRREAARPSPLRPPSRHQLALLLLASPPQRGGRRGTTRDHEDRQRPPLKISSQEIVVSSQ